MTQSGEILFKNFKTCSDLKLLSSFVYFKNRKIKNMRKFYL